MTTDSARETAKSIAATLTAWPYTCEHKDSAAVTCHACESSWCETCDPTPSALCHTCHGRGYSTAEIDTDCYAWLEGTLDVRRTFNSDGTLYSVALLLTFGGPNVWGTFTANGCDVAADWYSDVVHVWADCPTLSADILDIFNDWNVTR
jgi:hypothetical protein